ncbi:putative aminotransferase aclI [Lachnellula arida]|uniref:Putative aminotransferase aclI n=1 Tax=Lachnellula arida TaxID=1316785 RepID=A0A8T9BCU4_9HELO|nr:putative aminotransferase aclI [Lachnellula arida]
MPKQTNLESSGLSVRSRPKVANFLPILKTIDGLNAVAASVDVDMAMGENWLIREPLVAIWKKVVAEEFDAKELSYSHGIGGSLSLLSAFSSFFNQFFHSRIHITPEHVTTFAGASTCLDSLLYAICDEGDGILLPSPFWGGYGAFSKLRADVDIIPTASLPLQTALSSDIVAEVKTAYARAPDPKRIKALLMTNPHNPIGRCYSPSTLRELMAFCQEKGLHYISDEVFGMSAFGGEGDEKFTSALALVDHGEESPINVNRVHVIYGMSKDFGSAGIRMACLVSPSNRLVLEGSMLANYIQTSVFSSIYTRTILTSPSLPFILTDLKSQLATNYALLTQAFDKWGIDYLPTHAGFHLFAKLAKSAQTWEDEMAFVKQLLHAGVMVAPGKNFGGVDGQIGWVRMSFSIPEEKLRLGLERIRETLGLGKFGEGT